MAFYIWSNQIILCGLFVCFCAVQSGTCKKGLCTVQIKQCSWSTGKVLIWRETKKNLKVRQMFLLLKRNDEKWRCRYFLLHKQSRTNTSCTLRSCTFPVQWKATIATDYTSCSTDKEVELKEWWKQYKHDICTLLMGWKSTEGVIYHREIFPEVELWKRPHGERRRELFRLFKHLTSVKWGTDMCGEHVPCATMVIRFSILNSHYLVGIWKRRSYISKECIL